jgi:hypothetical protein
MGALALPIIAAVLVITVIGAWVALNRYDREHPPQDDRDPRRDRFRRDQR